MAELLTRIAIAARIALTLGALAAPALCAPPVALAGGAPTCAELC
jgi:hypothetical protein